MPRVSVISAAYNMESVFTFYPSLESILSQSLSDIEFIICDDGSTDNTYSVLCDFASRDSRVRVIRNECNTGLAASLNKCIGYARSPLLARHDLDDISHKDRLLLQCEYLDAHESVDVLGTAAEIFDERGVIGVRHFPRTVRREDFLFSSPYMHGSVVIRTETMRRVGGYRAEKITRRAEDYELFMRLFLICRGENLAECLYGYLENTDTKRRRRYKYRIDEARVRLRGFRALGLMPKALPYVIKPLAVGLIPRPLLERLKRKYRKGESRE